MHFTNYQVRGLLQVREDRGNNDYSNYTDITQLNIIGVILAFVRISKFDIQIAVLSLWAVCGVGLHFLYLNYFILLAF